MSHASAVACFLLHGPLMLEPVQILVVDDEPGVRESLRAILMPENVVHTAANGLEALALARVLPVDVLTLDLRMPAPDGLTVLREIRRFDRDVEALLVSGYLSADAEDDGAHLGAYDCVRKPFDVEQVRRLVRSAAARRRAIRRLRTTSHRLVRHLGDSFRGPIERILARSCVLDAGRAEAQPGRIFSEPCALTRYIEALFLLSDVRSGQRALRSEHVHLAEVLDALVAQRDLGGKKVPSLQFDCPPWLGAWTDGEVFLKLLEQLTDKAIERSRAAAVRITARQSGANTVSIDLETAPGGPRRATTTNPAMSETDTISVSQPSGDVSLSIARLLEIPLHESAWPGAAARARCTLPGVALVEPRVFGGSPKGTSL